MAKKIYIDNLGLGIFSFPILEFSERYGIAAETTPQLVGKPQALAARVYFGMLAEQPKPTKEGEVIFIDWENASPYKNGELVPLEKWQELEKNAKYSLAGGLLIPVNKADAQTAYFKALKNLQDWLVYYGLWDGIQKTLNEEKRKLQAQAAGIQESKAAAARALAYERMNEDITETARIEYAENQEKAGKIINEMEKKEEEIRLKLLDLGKGYFPTEEEKSNIPLLVLGAAIVYAIGKRKGGKK